MSYGGSRGSRGAGQVGPSLLLLGVLSGAVACSEGSTDPLTLAGAGGTDNGGAGGAVAAGGSSGGFSGSSGGFSGSIAAGGTAGSAGSGNPPATQVYDFTEGLEGFRISYYCLGPGANVACSSVEPAASVDDAGEPAASDSMLLGDFVLATHDAVVGSPAPSAEVELRFSAMGQIAELAVNIDSTDLTGKVLTAQVLMDEGGVPQTAGKLYVKTGPGYVFVDQGEITLTAGTWTTLTFSMPSAFYDPSTYDMTDVREIGIEFATPLAMAFSTTVLHVDNVQY